MKRDFQFEDRASSRRSKHEGESSSSLCDRLSRTRDLSQRQLPTDHDYAVPTREYQTDQSSLNPAPTAAGPVLERRKKQKQQQKRPHRFAAVDGSLHIREKETTRAEREGTSREDRRRGFSGEKGLWSVAEEALFPRSAFGGGQV